MATHKDGKVVVNGSQGQKRSGTDNKWVINRHRRLSCLGPRPVTKFGPKAELIDDHSVENDMSDACDPLNMVLGWKHPPKNVLIVGKRGDIEVKECFRQLAYWLVKDRKLVVYIEPAVMEETIKDNHLDSIKGAMVTWIQGKTPENTIDLIISLGGDGTLLHAASLYQSNCPPVVSFHMGSLGFLTSFKFSNYKQDLLAIMEGNGKLILRKRLDCMFMPSKSNSDDCNQNKREERSFNVLNELVIDRGTASYLSNLDVYCNDQLITSIQGDGLIVSTPTGSTAYAAAAGGSMVHPSVPGILITPVCAHVLSSRPVIVPAGVVLKIILSDDSRSGAFASFDGKNRQELKCGEGICVTTSIYPVPCLTKEDQINDWFTSLGECFQWNVRKRQKVM